MPILNAGIDVNLTVAVGDRITITNTLLNFVDFIPPGGVQTTLPSPAVITVGPGQAGVWVILSGGPDVSCTVAPLTPKVKSETTDGLLSTFMRVGGSILDFVDTPEAPVIMHVPADLPTKFAPQSATKDPIFDRFDHAFRPHSFAALGRNTRSKDFNFNFNLRSVMAKADARDAAAYGGMIEGDAGFHSRWNAWASGRYVNFDDTNPNADRDGHLWWVASGLSYRVSEGTTIGAFARVRMGEVDSVALDARLDSDFYGGGAFVATRLAGGLGLTGAVMYEEADNDISIEGAAGSFDSGQWTVEGRIDRRIAWGHHWIEPAVSLLYTNVKRDGYTDSIGTVVPGSELELGRLTYGPKIGTTIQWWYSDIKPFVRINGIWDFVSDGDYQLAGGVVISNADTALKLGGGLEVALLNGAVVTVAGDWLTFDDDLVGWSVTGAVGLPFAALGLGHLVPTGLVSLGLAASATDQSAKGNVRIPLN